MQIRRNFLQMQVVLLVAVSAANVVEVLALRPVASSVSAPSGIQSRRRQMPLKKVLPECCLASPFKPSAGTGCSDIQSCSPTSTTPRTKLRSRLLIRGSLGDRRRRPLPRFFSLNVLAEPGQAAHHNNVMNCCRNSKPFRSPANYPVFMALPTLDEIREAQSLVYRSMPPTPQYSWPLINQRLGSEAWIKHENHTPVGAFKLRGGLVYATWLKQTQPDLKGVVAATRGNFGIGVATAARLLDLKAVIVVPHGNSVEKNRATRRRERSWSSMDTIFRSRLSMPASWRVSATTRWSSRFTSVWSGAPRPML